MTSRLAAPAGRGPSGVTLQQLTPLVAPWKWTLIAIGVVIAAGAALDLAPPLVMQRIIDEHLTVGRPEGLLLLATAYLGAVAAVQGLGFVSTLLTAVAAQGALNSLRVRLFSHLQRLPLDYYDRTPLGDIISRCTADVETLDTLFSSGVVSVVTDLVRLIAVMVAMLVLSPTLSLISLLVLPPVVLITNFFRVRIREAERANRRAIGLLNTNLQETFSGVEVIRAFGREAVFVQRFRRSLRRALDAFNTATINAAAYEPIMTLLAAGGTAALLWVGSGDTLAAWGVSVGTLTAFVLLFQRFFKPITALGAEWQTVQSALSGAERIFQVLNVPEDAAAVPSEVATLGQDDRLAVDVRDVTFGYVPGRPVLHGVTLAVRRGEHVALVGRTGAGKSSLIHLLGGLYSPWSGTVRIGGADPATLSEAERPRLLGVVPQSVQLFSGTVYENLTLGSNGATREEVLRAARIAGADAFIESLPRGYDTALSGGGRGAGAQLSSGQRQLLALARALVADPLVLLFDEATAAVDNATDAAMRLALRDEVLAHGRAVITVAHRLAAAREADRVLVFEDGRVIEEGAPPDLVAKGGHFAALLELEAAGWNWRES